MGFESPQMDQPEEQVPQKRPVKISAKKKLFNALGLAGALAVGGVALETANNEFNQAIQQKDIDYVMENMQTRYSNVFDKVESHNEGETSSYTLILDGKEFLVSARDIHRILNTATNTGEVDSFQYHVLHDEDGGKQFAEEWLNTHGREVK